jgi:hypothetical protein
MPHLSTSGPSRMVFEHFQNYFRPKNSTNGFLSCFNFVFILHRATFHPKLHVSLEWPTS